MPRRTDPNQDYEDHGYDGPSKSQVKREMLELQALGPALLELPRERFEKIELDERLREALEELRRLKVHGARKRQMQYVGKLIRDADLAPIRAALAAFKTSRMSSKRAQETVEQWRERLIEGNEGLNAWLAAYPASDTPQLRAQLRDARREANNGARGKACRELFRTLRETLGKALAP